MNTMLAPINRFVETMIESAETFRQVKLEFDQKNNAVEACIRQLQDGITALMDQKAETGDPVLDTLHNSVQWDLGELLATVAKLMEADRKGTEFIRAYEQSFNVAVFGKVKAGKSYLGNFIMGNQMRDMGLETAYDKLPRPTVEVYDRGKVSQQDRLAEMSEEGNDQFFVDANEATSAIQLFRLGGMTWFDTPGIGSVTWENEMLAKDYVDNADLIVYTSNSDAAGTQQDFQEMKDLYSKGKRFLLLLTQSDTYEEDEDEDGEIYSRLVAKSESDRRDTEQYMRDTLEKNGLPQLRASEVLTISAKLAVKALEEQDEGRFADSHMGDFLEVLTNITKTEGAEQKRKTPLARMQTTIRNLLAQLEETETNFQKYRADLLKKQKDLSDRNSSLLDAMHQQCRSRVDTLIRQKTMEIEKDGKPISAEELSTAVSREIYDVLLETCAKEFSSIGQVLSDYKDKLQLEGLGDLKMKKDTIEYTVTVVNRERRDPDGLFEHIGAFFGKEYYRTTTHEESRSSSFNIGVNEQSIMVLTHGQMEKLFSDQVPGMMERLAGRYMKDLSDLMERADQCIQTAKKSLQKELGTLQ